MTRLTIGFGLALVALGIAGYFGTGAVHPTALIPAAVGLVLVVFGILARNPKSECTQCMARLAPR